MKIRAVLCRGISSALVVTVFASPMRAQQMLAVAPGEQAGATPGIAEPGKIQAPSSTRVIPFAGVLPNQPDGAATITFAIYPDQQSTSVLWTESQVVQITGGKYNVLLGATSDTGLPTDLFSADAAHWLGVQVNGSEQRFLLVSVPYAMKAVEAERLGGLLPSDFVTVPQLAAILKNSAAAGSGTSGQPPATGTGTFRAQAAAAGTPPQPATDFTDNNASEVLLVTQQGTGYAIHAITSGQQEAIFGQNDAIGGTALRAFATYPSGQSIGVLAETGSPDGIAALFNNRAGGKILSLRSNGAEVGSFDSLGNLTANGVNAGNVNAQFYFGNGGGLFNVPPSAVGASPIVFANAIVQRDATGSFAANEITANNFSGSGAGLFNIPPSAVGASPIVFANAIVQRDSTGSFAANIITANTFSGSGAGLFNILPSAVGASPIVFANAIVQRDATGSFAANEITANNFSGSGAGLFNIPPSAVGASPVVFANAIVQRDAAGSFAANQISASALNLSGNADFTSAASTAPVKAVLSSNTPLSCVASKELLIKTDAPAGQQLFICNATGNGYVLVGDGTAAGVVSVSAGDSSVTVGGTGATPSVAVASGGITADKLAANAVVGSIADNSLPPGKIQGTAATLGNNTFLGTQNMSAINVNGFVNIQGSPNAFINATNNSGTALQIQGGAPLAAAIVAKSNTWDAIDATSNASYGVSAISNIGTGVHAQGPISGLEAWTTSGTSITALANTGGKIISGNLNSPGNEVFSVDAGGNLFAFGNLLSPGAVSFLYPNSTTGTVPNGLVKLTANGLAVRTDAGNSTGAIGIAISGAGTTGNVQIAYAGRAVCQFDGTSTAIPGDYAGISLVQPGLCRDLGQNVSPGSGQIVGRVITTPSGVVLPIGAALVLLFGTEDRGGTLTTINTGTGLTGGPITSSGTISIANAGVTNAMLQNNTITVADGIGIGGGGTVALGGTVTLTNLGALSFNGRVGDIVPALGDYSFSQITGTASASQMPLTVALTNQSNTFTANQTINGSLTTNGVLAAGNSTPFSSVASVFDTSAAGNQPAFAASSSNNPAALFFSNAPTILTVGTLTHGVLSVTNLGMEVTGSLAATSLSGDGSGLTNITASKIGTLSQSDIATNTALNAETSARQTADDNLQASIGQESLARQQVEAGLLSSISAETTARQSDVANLQTSINNVSAADAKLAQSNTFTAGTQDFSGAGATLPVHAVLAANTPASCVASKELLIKNDAPAGQQLFICNGTGDGWNLVGDGAGGGVTTFNGRNGSVNPASGDYSFSQISGSASPAQLPTSTVYSNQVNTFSASQTVNGTLTASLFSGNGSGLAAVNAATLNGIPSDAYAQVHAINTFTSEQVLGPSNAVNPSLNMPAGTPPATPLAGDMWNNGGVIQYRDNASTTRSLVTTTQSGGMQMLKIVAAITPGTVANQSCTEQNFNVPGVSAGDVLLAVLQPSNSSPGTNIAIGGWRVSANNTVAIQFCNVSRNSSTPVAGGYTFAVMR